MPERFRRDGRGQVLNPAWATTLLHMHMASNPDKVMTCDYTGVNRWGGGEVTTIITDAGSFSYALGEYDASSSVITICREVVRVFFPEKEGCLDGATWTGNMREVFLESGLFEEITEWEPEELLLGDILLNEQQNCAVVQDKGITDFFYDELGERGRCKCVDYFDHDWDCVLRWKER